MIRRIGRTAKKLLWVGALGLALTPATLATDRDPA
jgi:hypothetical protein